MPNDSNKEDTDSIVSSSEEGETDGKAWSTSFSCQESNNNSATYNFTQSQVSKEMNSSIGSSSDSDTESEAESNEGEKGKHVNERKEKKHQKGWRRYIWSRDKHSSGSTEKVRPSPLSTITIQFMLFPHMD